MSFDIWHFLTFHPERILTFWHFYHGAMVHFLFWALFMTLIMFVAVSMFVAFIMCVAFIMFVAVSMFVAFIMFVAVSMFVAFIFAAVIMFVSIAHMQRVPIAHIAAGCP